LLCYGRKSKLKTCASTATWCATSSRRKPLVHAPPVTGTKHYLGPFESYEDNPCLPGLNFYYTQEDILFEAAAKGGFGWTVHRLHTMIGYARGNAMNMGVTLAVYATSAASAASPLSFRVCSSSGTS
jgi:hypothetical protein